MDNVPRGYHVVATTTEHPHDSRLVENGVEVLYPDYMLADAMARMFQAKLAPWFAGVQVRLEPVYQEV